MSNKNVVVVSVYHCALYQRVSVSTLWPWIKHIKHWYPQDCMVPQMTSRSASRGVSSYDDINPPCFFPSDGSSIDIDGWWIHHDISKYQYISSMLIHTSKLRLIMISLIILVFSQPLETPIDKWPLRHDDIAASFQEAREALEFPLESAGCWNHSF